MDFKEILKNSAKFISTNILNLSDKALQKRIFCPNCESYVYPYYKCAKCGYVYKTLSSNNNQLFYKKCVCGEKLATSILGGKNNLPLICSKCNTTLNKNYFNPFVIFIFGEKADEFILPKEYHFIKNEELFFEDNMIVLRTKNYNLDYLNSKNVLNFTKGVIFIIDDLNKAERYFNNLISILERNLSKNEFDIPLVIVLKEKVANPKDYLYDSSIFNLLNKFKNYKFFNIGSDSVYIFEYIKSK